MFVRYEGTGLPRSFRRGTIVHPFAADYGLEVLGVAGGIVLLMLGSF